VPSFETIKYNRSFIKQVILRVDFIDYLDSDSVFNKNVIEVIADSFPRKEKDQVIKFNVLKIENIKDQEKPNIFNQSIEGIQKTFTNRDCTNKCILSNKALVFEFNSYETFEIFMSSVSNIVIKLFMLLNKPITERIGLRFINIFDTDEIKTQKSFFSSNIAYATSPGIVNLDNDLKLKRSMMTAEYSLDDMTLNFRFGLYNKNYPAAIQKNDFVLDYDCFIQESINNAEDVISFINRGHNAIQLMFESSISDKLRKVMLDG
jgi:uncharacterized protein (TIGR04255 family)